MTPQEIFDTVATHLLAQGHQAKQGAFCMYRMPNGSKCAAGFLIPDEAYRPSMENKSFSHLCESGNYDLPGWMYPNKVLIANLQGVHDSEDVVANQMTRDFDRTKLIANLRHVAICYGLNSDVLNTVDA